MKEQAAVYYYTNQVPKKKIDVEKEIKYRCPTLLKKVSLDTDSISRDKFHDRYLITNSNIYIYFRELFF